MARKGQHGAGDSLGSSGDAARSLAGSRLLPGGFPGVDYFANWRRSDRRKSKRAAPSQRSADTPAPAERHSAARRDDKLPDIPGLPPQRVLSVGTMARTESLSDHALLLELIGVGDSGAASQSLLSHRNIALPSLVEPKHPGSQNKSSFRSFGGPGIPKHGECSHPDLGNNATEMILPLAGRRGHSLEWALRTHREEYVRTRKSHRDYSNENVRYAALHGDIRV